MVDIIPKEDGSLVLGKLSQGKGYMLIEAIRLVKFCLAMGHV